jgi:hypothetical protein
MAVFESRLVQLLFSGSTTPASKIAKISPPSSQCWIGALPDVIMPKVEYMVCLIPTNVNFTIL